MLDNDIVFSPSQNILEAIRRLDGKRKGYNLKNGYDCKHKPKPAKKSEPSDLVKHISKYGAFYFYLGLFVVFPLTVIGLIKIFGNIVMFIVMALFSFGVLALLKYIYKSYKFSDENREYYIKHVIFPTLKSIDSSFSKESNYTLREKYKSTLKDVLVDTDYIGAVSANINGVNISFSECNYMANNDEDENNVRFCYIADFNKNLTSDTIVSSISWQKIFSKRGYKKISLDNARFNRVFSVHTKNEVEARYILTPKFMEKLLQVYKDTSGVYFFGRNKIVYYGYFRDLSSLFFNIDLTKNIYESTKKSYERVRYIINFINELNLDSKVWK